MNLTFACQTPGCRHDVRLTPDTTSQSGKPLQSASGRTVYAAGNCGGCGRSYRFEIRAVE